MKKLPLFLLFLAIISCVHREKHPILSETSEHFDSLSVIAQRVTAIELDSHTPCILTEINQVKTDPSNIFFRSGNDIYRFDHTGSFCNKISVEHPAHIFKYTINAENQQVVLLDSLSLIHYYAYDGTLLFTKDVETTFAGQTILDMAYHDRFLWIVTQKVAENNAIEKWLYKFDLAFEQLEAAVLAPPDLGRFFLDGSFTSDLYVADNKVCVYSPFSFKETLLQDTLYLLSSRQLEQDQIFPHKDRADFPAYSIPYFVGKRYLMASYQTNASERANYLFCFDKKTGKSFSMNGFKDDFFHTGIVKDLLPFDLQKQEYYFCKSGEELSTSFPERDANANPVLFVVRLNG